MYLICTFSGCSSLTEISIPSSVTSIGGSAFSGCSSLTNVIIMAPSLTTYGSNAFTNNAEGSKIYVPIDAVETYKARWSSYANDIIGMSIYTVTLAEGTEDAENWTISPTTTQEGNTVTITYNGTKRLKSVKAEKVVE